MTAEPSLFERIKPGVPPHLHVRIKTICEEYEGYKDRVDGLERNNKILSAWIIRLQELLFHELGVKPK